MYALIETALFILDLYRWVVIGAIVMSWLVNYGVVNRYNHVAMTIGNILERLTEPLLRPIRRVIPFIGGLDLSPLVLLIAIFFLERLLSVDVPRMLGGIY